MASPQLPSQPENLPLPKDGELGSAQYFLDEIEASEDRLKEFVKDWKKDLARYDGERPSLEGVEKEDTVNVNVGYYTVEQKKPQLVFQTPFVQVAPKGKVETERAALVYQAVLNERMSRDFIDAETLLDEILHDNLVSSGYSATKIGYECIKKTKLMPTGRMVPDPSGLMTEAPADPNDPAAQPTPTPQMIPATGPDGQPETEPTPTVIWDDYYWRRFSPADLRVPAGFTAMHRCDEAPWIAWRFNIGEGEREARSVFGSGGGIDSELSLLSSKDREALDKIGSAYEIFYKAYLYDETEVNPEKIRQLIILPAEGRAGHRMETRVLVHRDSPYQRFDEHGEFIAGMKGYPVHILTTRIKPDVYSPYSDCRVLRDVADEKSMGRSLMVQQRKRSLPLRAVDKTRISAEDIKRLETGKIQSIILTDGPAHEIIEEVARAPYPVENFTFDSIAQQDVDRLAASGANQQALQTENVGTATEASIIAKSSETQQAKQRNRLLNSWLAGVEKLGSLIQLFAERRELIKFTDEQGVTDFVEWDKNSIQGRYAFDLKPDSSVRNNAAEERSEYLKLFNLLMNYPGANRTELYKRVITKWNEDPNKLTIPDDQQPQPEPEKPKVSIAIKGEDLDPLAPQYANVKAILETQGLMVPLEAQTPAEPETVNAGAPGEPVNKHTADLTGNRPGAGPAMPAVPGVQ